MEESRVVMEEFNGHLYEPRRSSRSWTPSAAMVQALQSGVADFFDKGDRALGLKRKRATKRPSSPLHMSASRELLKAEPGSDGLAGETATTSANGKRTKLEGEECPCCVCGYEAQDSSGDLVCLKCGGCGRYYHDKCLAHDRPVVDRDAGGLHGSEEAKPWYCDGCPSTDCREQVTQFRRNITLGQGSRDLLRSIMQQHTPRTDKLGRLKDPYGCIGLELRRGMILPADQAALLKKLEVAHASDQYQSMLTPSVTNASRKLFCCDEAQRRLRGGRYASCPLRTTSTLPLLRHTLVDGQDMNSLIQEAFPSRDPFVTSTKITWHYHDLDLHCDKDRQDKTHKKQTPGLDGVGDRITSLTLRTGAWLLMRRTSDISDCFAIRLEPGDVYTMSGDSRWKWQHGIYLDGVPEPRSSCRVSIVFRAIEEHPE